MKYASATVLTLWCLVLIGCTNLPSLDQSLSEYRASQEKAAKEAEQDKRFAQALSLWRSQLPLNAADPEVQASIERLQKKIQRQSRHALRKGEEAYSTGNSSAGDTWMLKVLALKPGHQQALAHLRKSTSKQAQAEQAAKLSDKTTIVPPHPSVKPQSGIPLMREQFELGNFEKVISLGINNQSSLANEDVLLVHSSYVALADRAAIQGNRLLELDHLQKAILTSSQYADQVQQRITGLKIELSEDWYRRGSSMIHGDLGGAIVALEKSIDYNPKNTRAKLKLKQAKTLRRNLDKIKSG